MTPPAAGWYPDPSGQARERFWDGRSWGEATREQPRTGIPRYPLPPPPSFGGSRPRTPHASFSDAPGGSAPPHTPGPPVRSPVPPSPPPGDPGEMVPGRFGLPATPVPAQPPSGTGRRAARSTVPALVALVPVSLATALVMGPLGYGAWLLAGAWGVLGLAACWLLPASVYFAPATQPHLARWNGCRQPTSEEARRLHAPWREVLGRTGGDPADFTVVVVDSEELNAYVTGRSVVAVTSETVRRLQPFELEAVLAHELGHHRGLHTVPAFAQAVLTAPVRFVWWAARGCLRLVRKAWRGAVLWRTPAGFLGVGLLAVAAGALWIVLAAPAALALAGLALTGGTRARAEYQADRYAAELGFGPVLLGVLEGLIDAGRHGGSRSLIARRAERLRAHLAAETP
ncbi:M48 family metalloprotease [Actinomadura sp. DSM 109109]|nr:M48 family metalloprotease [Actinomadura lepetitiana]